MTTSRFTIQDIKDAISSNGWVKNITWERTEAFNVFKYNNCKTIDECRAINSDYYDDVDENKAWFYRLSNLTDGSHMFQFTPLESFSADLSSLTNGECMFSYSALASFNGDLSNLVYGWNMFYYTPLESFNGNLSSLNNGERMFSYNTLESFNSDLSSLTNGTQMFRKTHLRSFSGDLSSLTNGSEMFHETALESFNVDLSSLTYGGWMFYNSALESFSGDLSSLVNGTSMFSYNQPRHYEITFYNMAYGTYTQVTKTVVSNGLKSFTSDLSSLEDGYHMFGDGKDVKYAYFDDNGNIITETTKNAAPLDEASIANIATTIKDISDLDLSKTDGQLWLGYDSSITDTTNINAYCNQIAAKGWKVYLNGSQYTSTDSDSAALIDGESTSTPIPHYYKPVQVTDEEIAEYVDGNNNYYIIVGAQHVFGDDISTYGMFTSFEHAIEQISSSLGLTPYEKPTEETTKE